MKTREDFDTAEEYMAYLEGENQRLKTQATRGNDLRIKVSEKGAISVYGLGRWPVTLYKSQMLRFLAHGQEIVEFIRENDSKLAEKGDVAKAA